MKLPVVASSGSSGSGVMLSAARDAMAAEERTAAPVLPAFAAAFEGHIQWGNPIEEILMPYLHQPGYFVSAPSVVTSMGDAMKVSYTTKMATRLYRHFNERKDGIPVPPTHTYVNASKVLYMHADVARLFAQWLETQGSKKRAENERQSKKRSAAANSAAAPTTTGPGAADVATSSSSSSSSSSALSPDSTSSPSMPLQEIDTNIMPPTAAASQPKPAKCLRTEKEEARTLALEELKFRIAELRENAKFFLNFTNTEFLPADETARELTDLLLSYETVVVSRALKDVDEYLKQYCPEAISKVNWKCLSFRKSVAPALPDVDQIFSLQPLPCPVPLSK